MSGISQVLLGGLALSVVHALIPNHWLPLVVIGKAQTWSRPRTLMITAIVGFAHTSSTVVIGALLGRAGYELASAIEPFTTVVAPVILVVLGAVFLYLDFRRTHHHHHTEAKPKSGRSTFAIVSSLSAAMFFSPCLEVEAYFLYAGSLGWQAILTLSAVYLVMTVLGMMLLVDLGRRGIQKIRSHFLEDHERGITGLVLIVLAVLAFFIEV